MELVFSEKEVTIAKAVEGIRNYCEVETIPLERALFIVDAQEDIIRQFELNPRRVHNRLYDKVNGILTLGGIILEPIKISRILESYEEQPGGIDWDGDQLAISSGRHRLEALRQYCLMTDTNYSDVEVPYILNNTTVDMLAMEIFSGNNSRAMTGTEKDNCLLSMSGIDTNSPADVLNYTLEGTDFARGFSFFVRSVDKSEFTTPHTIAVLAKKTASKVRDWFKDKKEWKEQYSVLFQNREFVKKMSDFFIENLPIASTEFTNVARNVNPIAIKLSSLIEKALFDWLREKGHEVFTLTQLRSMLPEEVWKDKNGKGHHMEREEMVAEIKKRKAEKHDNTGGKSV